MSLYCAIDSDGGDHEWWWYEPDEGKPLDTKRSRKCCSCKSKIEVGQTARRVPRCRAPSDRCDYIEESIYGDEVPLADYWLCETCGDLYDSITELGFCCSLGDQSLQSQIKEYRGDEAAWKKEWSKA